VEVPLAEGGLVLVEVDEPFDGPVVRGRSGAVALPPLEDTLEHVLSSLGAVTRAVASQLRSLADSPHEIEVEFAIKLSADARIVIVRAGGEANFRIALKWARSPVQPSPLDAKRQ
jgi:Trypsin-co-occurring domain 1